MVLSIPDRYARFPDWDGARPPLPQGTRLLRCKDQGAATKFAAPARQWPDAALIICDDDCLYGAGWLEALTDGWDRRTVRAASSFDGGRIGARRATILQGFAGIALPPAIRFPARLERYLCTVPEAVRLVDDIWLSALVSAAGFAVETVPTARAYVRPLHRPHALQDETDRAGLNARAVALARDRLGVWG